MITKDTASKKNTKPGKRAELSNHCLSCTRRIPANKDFCDNDICENNFYDESQLDRELDEALAEQEELEREEGKSKAGLFDKEGP